jgi:hypothetical protein
MAVSRRRAGIALLVAAVAVLSVLGGGVASAAPSARVAPPSKKARMICAGEAKDDIAGVLAITPVKVTKPTWVDRTYSCTYQYPTGSFALSVKQLPSRTATTAYFTALGTTLQRLPNPLPMGDGAFQTPGGSMVVRKDNNVLVVDASKLPAEFSKLKLVPAVVAQSVAMTILGCWKG